MLCGAGTSVFTRTPQKSAMQFSYGGELLMKDLYLHNLQFDSAKEDQCDQFEG